MIKKSLVFSILLFILNCTANDTVNTLSKLPGELNFIDTVKLDQSIIPISDFYRAKLINDTILVIPNLIGTNAYLYGISGAFLFELSEEYFDIHVLPKMAIADINIFQNHIYFAYWGNNCIYKFDLAGEYNNRLCFNYPKDYKMKSNSWSKIVNEDTIIIESEYNNWQGSIKNKFTKSPFISTFNFRSGEYLGSRGAYPSYFYEGNLALQRHILLAWQRSDVYALLTAGPVQFQNWTASGLVEEWHIPLEKHDEQVSYFKSDPWSGDLMDQIIELGSDENNLGIFYGLYRYFENNLRNEGENTYGLRFFKLNLQTNSFFEQDMEESYADIGSLVMIPTVKNDTIRFLKKEQEEVYLLTATTLN
ncbi:MAG: hypothetical protein AAF519_16320, partial [Bacteroidota bacterium]